MIATPLPVLPEAQAPAVQSAAAGGGAAAALAGRWVLRANCSLAPKRLCAVLGSLVLLSTLIGAGFWCLGAPWVLPFAGVEMIALALALWIYARRVEDGEELWLQGDTLHLHARCGSEVRLWAFPVAWVTVRFGGHTDGLIELACAGQRVRAGARLPAHRRAQMAISIRQSLRTAGFVGLEPN